jgi:KRAB domain-containing zinc finger protein
MLPMCIMFQNLFDLFTCIYHVLVYAENSPYSCSVCMKTFSSSSWYVKKHTSINSRVSSASINQNGHLGEHIVDKLHSCSICFKSFSSKGSLQDHQNFQNMEKPFSCSLCTGKLSFSNRAHLNRHFKIHKKKSCSCSLCSDTFVTMFSLKTHVKTHLGSEPHNCSGIPNEEESCTCSVCSKQFSQRSSLMII